MTIYKPESEASLRMRLLKTIKASILKFSKLESFTEESKDICAYVILALLTTSEGVNRSATAWEKRGYWLKADKFRQEWNWLEQMSDELLACVKDNTWEKINLIFDNINQKLINIEISTRYKVGRPWIGAMVFLNEKIKIKLS